MNKTCRYGLWNRWAISSICLAAILLGSCEAAKSSKAASADYWPIETWRTSDPGKQGFNSRILNKIDEYVKKDFSATSSVLIVRNGYIIFEKYYQGGKEDLRPQYSVTKSLMSALTGIAIAERLIRGTGDEIYQYMPDSIRSGITTDERKITIRHLLTHTSGLGDNGGDGDIEAASLLGWFKRGLSNTAGEVFELNGNNANILSVIITQTSGMRVSEFAREYLFDPIGIKQAKWDEGSEWTSGFSGSSLTTRDMARIGYLFLRKGKWNNKQVIPEDWVAASTQEQMPIPLRYQTPGINDAHGYLWWTMWYNKHSAYAAIGSNGQRICVVPDFDLVIVFTGVGGGFDVEHLPIIRDCILGSIIEK